MPGSAAGGVGNGTRPSQLFGRVIALFGFIALFGSAYVSIMEVAQSLRLPQIAVYTNPMMYKVKLMNLLRILGGIHDTVFLIKETLSKITR